MNAFKQLIPRVDMYHTITALNKVTAVAIFHSLLSLSVMMYNIERIITKETKIEDKESNKKHEIAIHIIMIMVTSLTLLVNLLLCQGAMDLASINLYFWPDPHCCKMSWLLVYVTILPVYVYGMASCFYLACIGSEHGNVFAEENFIARGFIYLAADIIVILSIYYVLKWYSKV